MKISNYGIKVTTINSCIQVFTIKVKFDFDMRIKEHLDNSMFYNDYFLVIDKNGKENLVINYGTADGEKFIQACKEFEVISINNKLNRIIDKTNLSRTEMSKILMSKMAFNV